jgi:ATP-dependent Lon protease
VNKSVSGLMKLLFPDPDMPIDDADLEWAVKLAMEAAGV